MLTDTPWARLVCRKGACRDGSYQAGISDCLDMEMKPAGHQPNGSLLAWQSVGDSPGPGCPIKSLINAMGRDARRHTFRKGEREERNIIYSVLIKQT